MGHLVMFLWQRHIDVDGLTQNVRSWNNPEAEYSIDMSSELLFMYN